MGYHFNVKFVSRGKGQSLVAKGAYDARAKFREERTGEIKDYTHKPDRPVQSFIFVDKKHGPEFQDNEKLLNLIDAAETQINSQTGLSFTAALPKQLSDEDRARLVRDFGREEFLRKNIPAVGHIHAPHEYAPSLSHANDNDQHAEHEEPEAHNGNWHVHFKCGTRTLGADGKFSETKYITWDNYHEFLEHKRERWAELGARYLEKAGHKIEAERWRYGHLTNPEQMKKALERGDHEWAEEKAKEAGQHRGPTVHAMERKGQDAERNDLARDVDQLAALKLELSKTNLEIWTVEHEAQREIHWQDALAQAAIEKENSRGGREKTIDEMQQPELAEKVLDGTSAVLEFSIECVEMLADFLTGGTPPPTRQQILGEILADIDELKRQGQRSISRQDDLIGKMLDAGERLTELGMEGFEMLADFFGGATAITPERIQAAIQERKELMRLAAAEQRLERWATSRRHDELDRLRGQHQPEIKDEQRRHYEGQYELER